MSRLFPHPPYAEDQPFPHTILTAHVLYRGFQAGALIGLLYGGTKTAYRQGLRSALGTSTGLSAVTRSVGYGSMVGTTLMVVMLPLRMRGREEIEWRDRSWRLLENEGQMLVDDFSGVGTLVGLGSMAFRNSAALGPLGWKEVLGRAGLGSLAGVLGYLVYTAARPKGETKLEVATV
jgi:hypothetical protein